MDLHQMTWLLAEGEPEWPEPRLTMGALATVWHCLSPGSKKYTIPRARPIQWLSTLSLPKGESPTELHPLCLDLSSSFSILLTETQRYDKQKRKTQCPYKYSTLTHEINKNQASVIERSPKQNGCFGPSVFLIYPRGKLQWKTLLSGPPVEIVLPLVTRVGQEIWHRKKTKKPTVSWPHKMATAMPLLPAASK